MTGPRKKSRRKRDSNPGPSTLEADALTTRPTRRYRERERERERERVYVCVCVSYLVPWELKHGKRSVGGQARTLIDLPAAMDDRVGWRKRAIGGGVGAGRGGRGGDHQLISS